MNIMEYYNNRQKNLVAYIAEYLESVHWDGTGCGTHGVNACVNCFGPSPMDVYEVVRVVLQKEREFMENAHV